MGTVRRCHFNIAYYLIELERLKTQATTILDLIERSR